jgi:recombination protein RecT
MTMSQQMQRAVPDRLEPFRQALAAQEATFRAALPTTVARYLTPDRIAKVVLSALAKTPTLMQCTQPSILRAVMDAVSLGLEPAGPLGHAYLVPFKKNKKDAQGNWTSTMEAQLIIGYRGFIALARRSGEIQSVNANVIYSRDRYRVNLADGTIEHEPYMPPMPTPEEAEAKGIDPIDLMHRGQPIAVYSIAQFTGGGRHVDFMTIGDVERIRERSKSGNDGPWVTDYDEMARKTVVRRAAKYWPLSTELASALEHESADDVLIAPVDRPVMRELPAPTILGAQAPLAPAPAKEPATVAAAPQATAPQQAPASADVADMHPDDVPPFDETDEAPPVEEKPKATSRVLNRVRGKNGTQPPAPAREPGAEG